MTDIEREGGTHHPPPQIGIEEKEVMTGVGRGAEIEEIVIEEGTKAEEVFLAFLSQEGRRAEGTIEMIIGEEMILSLLMLS